MKIERGNWVRPTLPHPPRSSRMHILGRTCWWWVLMLVVFVGVPHVVGMCVRILMCAHCDLFSGISRIQFEFSPAYTEFRCADCLCAESDCERVRVNHTGGQIVRLCDMGADNSL